eukprot:gb/GECG01009243.1/.p1 GENE.gb/GECG01009243.1/~~gb/GECG01009243.1/.p1  ORF type:complete len:315 (+),score=43.43 gb/GECG01009243.1/:1-945(+)
MLNSNERQELPQNTQKTLSTNEICAALEVTDDQEISLPYDNRLNLTHHEVLFDMLDKSREENEELVFLSTEGSATKDPAVVHPRKCVLARHDLINVFEDRFDFRACEGMALLLQKQYLDESNRTEQKRKLWIPPPLEAERLRQQLNNMKQEASIELPEVDMILLLVRREENVWALVVVNLNDNGPYVSCLGWHHPGKLTKDQVLRICQKWVNEEIEKHKFPKDGAMLEDTDSSDSDEGPRKAERWTSGPMDVLFRGCWPKDSPLHLYFCAKGQLDKQFDYENPFNDRPPYREMKFQRRRFLLDLWYASNPHASE